MAVFILSAILKAPGLKEVGTITTDAGAVSLSGVYLDKEDVEEFMEMEIESDTQIFYVMKKELPTDAKKGDTLILPARNSGNPYTIIKLLEDKTDIDIMTKIFLSND